MPSQCETVADSLPCWAEGQKQWAFPDNPWKKREGHTCAITVLLALLFLYGLSKLCCTSVTCSSTPPLPNAPVLWRLFCLPHLRLLCGGRGLNHRHVGEGKRQVTGGRIFSLLEVGTDRLCIFLSFSPQSTPSDRRSFSLKPWESWLINIYEAFRLKTV